MFNKSLITFFLLSAFSVVLQIGLLQQLSPRPIFFLPIIPLIISLYKTPISVSLMCAILTGLLLDFYSQTPLGIFTGSFFFMTLLTTALLHSTFAKKTIIAVFSVSTLAAIIIVIASHLPSWLNQQSEQVTSLMTQIISSIITACITGIMCSLLVWLISYKRGYSIKAYVPTD